MIPVLLVLLSQLQHATAFSLIEWLHNPYPNGTLKEEIQCYSLPYGGVGFASHLLTYYVVIMLANQRSPWTLQKNKHKKVDQILSGAGLLVTFIVSILTIVRCRSRWQFIAMGVWKLVLSVSLGCLSFHAASLVGSSSSLLGTSDQGEYLNLNTQDINGAAKLAPKGKSPQRVLWWTLLYVPGVVTGLTGLLSLVFQEINTNRAVEQITLVFGTVVLTVAIMILGVVMWLSMTGNTGAFGMSKVLGENSSVS
jgi:hypothetical protein